ncbi:MAG TPA: ROK family transcriptional regulator [Terriglobales bacterium]|jgi:predicted NBD/HSP70 family sugar kinase|nr:ROK family transcriptional regulator [Terriglobales bacterium]
MRRTNIHGIQGATSETARGINRGIILNLIRRRQPISRADLARASGLQPSTVSLITEQLIREKWVIYGSVGRLPRGRRPTFLQLNERRALLALDLRPSLSTVAVADVNGRFLERQSIQTPATPEIAEKVFSERFLRMISDHPELLFEGIGVVIPGRFDEKRSKVVFAPNLKWPEFNLKDPLEKATGLPVKMENAANACVLAEVWFSQVATRNLLAVTISEGVGVGIFIDGHLLHSANGMAGEFGHVSLDPTGPVCGCGARGCWEVYASNWASLRSYGANDPAKGPTFQDLLSLAETGDQQALRALDHMAEQIGRGMRMVIASLSPEEIVFVGEFTRLWDHVRLTIERAVKDAVLVGKPPLVRPAAAEPSVARLRGTVALVLQEHFGFGLTRRLDNAVGNFRKLNFRKAGAEVMSS